MNIPTAEEFLKKYNNHDHSKSEGCSCRYRDIVALREFAKLHVEAALKEAFNNSEMRVSENDTNEHPSFTDNYDDSYVTITVSKDSILNAYPLENIK
jgi:hypothetical protein